MALLQDNLVLSKDGRKALVELLQSRQPGDRLSLHVDVVIVENLPGYASFDVEHAEEMSGAMYAEPPAPTGKEKGAMSYLADSVIGVMMRKKPS